MLWSRACPMPQCPGTGPLKLDEVDAPEREGGVEMKEHRTEVGAEVAQTSLRRGKRNSRVLAVAVRWAWPRGLGAKPQVVAVGLGWVAASPDKAAALHHPSLPQFTTGAFFGLYQGNCWRSRQGT